MEERLAAWLEAKGKRKRDSTPKAQAANKLLSRRRSTSILNRTFKSPSTTPRAAASEPPPPVDQAPGALPTNEPSKVVVVGQATAHPACPRSPLSDAGGSANVSEEATDGEDEPSRPVARKSRRRRQTMFVRGSQSPLDENSFPTGRAAPSPGRSGWSSPVSTCSDRVCSGELSSTRVHLFHDPATAPTTAAASMTPPSPSTIDVRTPPLTMSSPSAGRPNKPSPPPPAALSEGAMTSDLGTRAVCEGPAVMQLTPPSPTALDHVTQLAHRLEMALEEHATLHFMTEVQKQEAEAMMARHEATAQALAQSQSEAQALHAQLDGQQAKFEAYTTSLSAQLKNGLTAAVNRCKELEGQLAVEVAKRQELEAQLACTPTAPEEDEVELDATLVTEPTMDQRL